MLGQYQGDDPRRDANTENGPGRAHHPPQHYHGNTEGEAQDNPSQGEQREQVRLPSKDQLVTVDLPEKEHGKIDAEYR